MEFPVETKILWAIEKEAKLLIFPMFENQSEPATSVEEPQQEEVQRKVPKPDAPVFNLAKSAEENYAFFISDRVGESDEDREGFEDVVNFMGSRLPDIDREKLKVISFVFLNYQDICFHFYRDLYPQYAEHLSGGIHGQMMGYIIATAMMMHTKDSAQVQLNAVDNHLKIIQQIGDGNEKQAATVMKALNPYDKVFMYIAHQLMVSQHRDMVCTFPDLVEENKQLYAQLSQLGKILSGVLAQLNDDINP